MSLVILAAVFFPCKSIQISPRVTLVKIRLDSNGFKLNEMSAVKAILFFKLWHTKTTLGAIRVIFFCS